MKTVYVVIIQHDRQVKKAAFEEISDGICFCHAYLSRLPGVINTVGKKSTTTDGDMLTVRAIDIHGNFVAGATLTECRFYETGEKQFDE